MCPLLLSPVKELQLSAIRVLRTLLTLKDDSIARAIAKPQEFYSLLFSLAKKNKRENMVYSSFLDLLSCIATEAHSSLVLFFMESYGTELKLFPGAYKKLQEKQEKILQLSQSPNGSLPSNDRSIYSLKDHTPSLAENQPPKVPPTNALTSQQPSPSNPAPLPQSNTLQILAPALSSRDFEGKNTALYIKKRPLDILKDNYPENDDEDQEEVIVFGELGKKNGESSDNKEAVIVPKKKKLDEAT